MPGKTLRSLSVAKPRATVGTDYEGEQIIANLHQQANTQAIEAMARFGSTPAHALGISIPILRKMAKEIGRNHLLAAELWASGIREAQWSFAYSGPRLCQ